MASRIPSFLSTHPAPTARLGAQTITPSYHTSLAGNGLIKATAHPTARHPKQNQVKKLSMNARLLSPPPTPMKKQNASTQDTASNSRPSPSNPKSPSQDEMRINFGDLEMTRTTKFVVYAVISVLGTLETIFWCKAAWRWWKGAGGEEET
ncbi:hypothetical protein GGR57DRAFT_159948 [Xylariaceae sp. FL1272]|nr:hypothetical protein GGR57DRAFT_159948 [Xylariaceae sp. FL1272]